MSKVERKTHRGVPGARPGRTTPFDAMAPFPGSFMATVRAERAAAARAEEKRQRGQGRRYAGGVG